MITWIIFSIIGLPVLISIVVLIVSYKLIKKTSIKSEDIYNYIKNIWNKYIMQNVKTNKNTYLLK